MKYANEARAEGVPVRTGEILYEAMPWLKQVTGKTIVINNVVEFLEHGPRCAPTQMVA